jgi:D-alanyl-lipoteichoic acid acyltransferase DltB (MBOAT superfamily)
MVPWIVLQFIAAPVSIVFHILVMPLVALSIQILGMMASLGAVLLALRFGDYHVEALVGGSIVFYFVMLCYVVLIVMTKSDAAKNESSSDLGIPKW